MAEDSWLIYHQGVLYVSAAQQCDAGSPIDGPEEVLLPYVEATLDLIGRGRASPPQALFRLFYARTVKHCRQEMATELRDNRILCSQPLPSHFSINGDTATIEAERLFSTALKLLSRDDIDSFWSPLQADDDIDDE